MTSKTITQFVTCMDNTRVIKGSKVNYIKRVYRLATELHYDGQQNIARNIREPSQPICLCTYTLMDTDNSDIHVSTSQDKKAKGKSIIEAWCQVYLK